MSIRVVIAFAIFVTLVAADSAVYAASFGSGSLRTRRPITPTTHTVSWRTERLIPVQLVNGPVQMVDGPAQKIMAVQKFMAVQKSWPVSPVQKHGGAWGNGATLAPEVVPAPGADEVSGTGQGAEPAADAMSEPAESASIYTIETQEIDRRTREPVRIKLYIYPNSGNVRAEVTR